MGNWTSIFHSCLEAAAEAVPAEAGDGGDSAVYDKLPADAEKHRVRNVYDGDTLTLTDERRVRLLGIDTPEIKEKQPFAQEAKQYTKERCDKKDIWISFEPSGDKEDHYGRILAYVWVPEGGRYLCVNEGIVAAGFASAYRPNTSTKLHNWDKLVALQKEARTAGRGMWSTFEDYTVVKTANGSAFHKRSCEHLSNTRNLTELKASEATEMGLHPCRTCLADA
jgi:endonuclease YncB( thermonuclease family)